MFDTHCHLSEAIFARHLSTVLQEAQAAGVNHFLSVSAAYPDWARLSKICQENNPITPAFGIHPLFTANAPATAFTELEILLQRHPQAAVGEIGLDFYHRTDTRQKQRQIDFFTRQIIIARDKNRPVVLHQRKTQQECIRLLRENGFDRGGFTHAFSGSIEQAKLWLDEGFVIGIGTVLLREPSHLRQLLPYLPRHGWVAESDAPFMQADNQPAQVAHILRLAATLRHESPEDVSAYTTANAQRILYRASTTQ